MKNLTYIEYKKIVNFYKQNVLFVMDKEDFDDVETREMLIKDLPNLGYLVDEYSNSKKNYLKVEDYLEEFQVG